MQIDSDSYVRIHMYRAKEELLPGGFHASYVCMRVRVHACVCVCQSCAGMCAVDSTYQPLTVAWAGVLLVWQPLPLLLLLQLRSLVLLTHLPFIVFSVNQQLLALQTHAHTHTQCRGDKDATYVYTHW